MAVQKVLSLHVIALMQGGQQLAREHLRLLLEFLVTHTFLSFNSQISTCVINKIPVQRCYFS